jgi:nucleolar protein 4
VLTVDPSSSLASRLVIHGRTLSVSRAVTREIAGNLKEDAEHARQKGDKRNTYLMREGVVFPNSPAAAALPETEVEKRQQAFNARKTLLRSNPSLYISKTRLSVRQLPLFVTDRGLKRLAIYATREFDAEIKAGTREGLTRLEESDDTLSPALAGRSKKRGERPTPVVQSKVVRQTEKLDPLTGAGRSRGYGFLEMRSHKEALKVLRWANNNAAVGALVWEWWTAELAEIKERAEAALVKARAAAASGESAAPAAPGKEKESIEDLEARIKKLNERIAEGDERSAGGMRGGKTLLIEFSVENVQVVRRRVDKISSTREGGAAGAGAGGKRKAGTIAAEDSDDESGPSGKRARFDRNGKGGKGDFKKGDRRDSRDDRKGGRDDRKGGRDDRKGGKFGRRESMDARVPKPAPAPEEQKGIEKLGGQLGSLIGRKRKMRRGGK